MENPAVRLAPVVSRLFEIAGDTSIPKKTRDDAFFYASKLRGYMVNLISKQFDKATAQYTKALDKLREVNADLKVAKTDIEKITKTVQGLASLASALDKLLLAAAKIATPV